MIQKEKSHVKKIFNQHRVDVTMNSNNLHSVKKKVHAKMLFSVKCIYGDVIRYQSMNL